MTDEHSDAGLMNLLSSPDAEPHVHHLDAHHHDHHSDYWEFAPEMYMAGTALAVYFKAFVEALAKRHADGLADLAYAHVSTRTSLRLKSAWMAMRRRRSS